MTIPLTVTNVEAVTEPNGLAGYIVKLEATFQSPTIYRDAVLLLSGSSNGAPPTGWEVGTTHTLTIT